MQAHEPSSGRRKQDILRQALKRKTPQERAAFLDGACGADAALRGEIEALLASHEEGERGSALNEQLGNAPAGEGPTEITPTLLDQTPLTERPGTVIGRYKLLEQIGEGGFGVVYVAEQREPVKRRVALKVIKLGMDTKQVVARFEAERQALALMDHPNIAKVLDAGATDTGRPYFVMELVKGIPITKYCEQERTETTEKLNLFIQVCHAIQHAHQKGIIHRDIKPSNILVTLHDGEPVPKVIDFGIAKATQQELTEKTVYTQFQQFIGTPAYMSPEQAEMSGLDIDTRSDIYSLGVLLYELLTGSTPFDTKELLQSGLDEMRKIIREREPVRPSTRLSQTRAAQHPSSGEFALRSPQSAIDADLDWIVMKCLEKDRRRRYETANGVALDIERHLKHEPVMARPPSVGYRLQKSFRRNRLVFAATGAVMAALLIGLGLSTWLFFKEQHARRRAVVAEQAQSQLRQQAEANAKRAQAEAKKSEQTAQFLKNMLKGMGPAAAKGRDTQMQQEMLDQAAERVGKDLKDSPEVEAGLRTTLGDVYQALEQLSQAEKMHRAALELNRRLWGSMNTNVADSLERVGGMLMWQGKPKEGEPFILEALTIRTNLLGHEHPKVAESLRELGDVRWKTDRFVEAEELYRQFLAMERKLVGNDSQAVVWCLENLAFVLLNQGKPQEAEASAREALAIQNKLVEKGPPDRELGLTQYYLGCILNSVGKLGEAETLLRTNLATQRKLLSPDNPLLAPYAWELANVLEQKGEVDETIQLLRETAVIWRKRQAGSNSDPDTFAMCLYQLGGVLIRKGDLAEAEAVFREAVTVAAKLWPNDFARWRWQVYGLIDTLHRQGKQADAYRLMGEILTPELLGQSRDAVLLEVHANLLGRGGHWRDAAADYARLIEIEPTNYWLYHQYAPVLVLAHDLDGYRQLCRRLLARFGSTEDVGVSALTALNCLLLPPSSTDLPTLGHLAGLAVTAGVSHPWAQIPKGLAEYRQGNFAGGVEWAQKALLGAGKIQEQDAQAYALLAMAQHQMKHTDEARAALEKAAGITQTKSQQLESSDFGPSWWDRAVAHILLREAKALIEGERAAIPPPKP